MKEIIYSLTNEEKQRLNASLESAFTIPIIADVEGFVWEAIFHYVKGIELADSLSSGRTKLLFDAVAADGRGWSLKTILKNNLTPGTSFEFVIQRADIFTKSHQLGFPEGLTQNSLPGDLGTAIIRHWNQKFQNDCRKQNVRDPRLAILLKNKTRQNLSYLELAYSLLNEDDYTWQWSLGEKQRGLQGFQNGRVQLKWYPSGTQLFQVCEIPSEVYNFQLEWKRATLSDFFEQVRRLNG